MRNVLRKTQVLLILLLLMGIAESTLAQMVIKGMVTDAGNNQTLPGVNITIKGTMMGTITDVDGNYSITVQSANDILVFSFIGYRTEEITVGNNSQIDVTITQDVVDLGEIVVMGYSEKTKREISSAVSVLPMEKVQDVTSNSVTNMLQGKVAGVEVINATGQPGSEAEIRIRGIASVNAPKGPLFVVDGIIGGNYDPNDVETVTVLKDAGATGMYGSQANGGVILITTKKGKSSKTQYDFKGSVGFRIADQGHLDMLSGSKLYDAQKELYRDYASGKIDILKFYNERPLELKSRNYDWENELFRSALVQYYYLSASRSTDNYAYYIGGNYFDEGGTFVNTGYKKVNLRANTTYKFSKAVTVDNNINIGASMGTSYDYMDMYYAYLSMPWDSPYDDNGNLRYVDGTSTDWWSRDKINPLHTIENSDHNYKGMDVNYDFILGIRITNWLSFSSSNRLSLFSAKSHNFVSRLAAGTYHDKGYVQESSDLGYGGITTNLLKFNYDVNKHSISGLAGYEAQGDYYETMSAEGKGLPEGFDVLSVASGEYLIGGRNDRSFMNSFIAQFNYNFAEKYFLTGSYRLDATSAFPPDNRTASFPSVAASWLMSNENFLKSNKVIDLLKLRLSYGITGMKDIGAYQYLGLFSLSTQYNNNPAAIPYQLPSPNLTWEKTHQLNLGIDISLVKRVSLNLDLYNNTTKDLLIQVAQPLSVGFEKKWENVGKVSNKGLEVTLSTINIRTSSFEWTMDLTYSMNKNELKEIGKPIYRTVNGIAQIYRDNGALYMFVLPKWLGVNTETGAPMWEHIEYDAEGNVTSTSATSDYSLATPQEIKSALPKFLGGFSTTLKYKGISFYMNLSYMYGNYVYNFTRRFMDNDGHEPYYNLMEWKDGWSRWAKPGDVATHPSIQNSALSTENSSRFLEDGSYLKIRNITIKYDLPRQFVKKMKLEGLAVSVSGDNIFTFTPYWGQDPEVTINPSDWSMPGVSDFRYPPSRQFVFSLELKF
jgi:TonB-linked SusC/RagA family outer membrane protein